jgi:HK97 family phage portal protein
MGLWGMLAERRGLEQSFVDNPREWLVAMFGGRALSSGVAVTPTTAMQCTVVYACVRVLAETISSLPLFAFRRLDDGGKERDLDHPLTELLHDQPNPEMTALEWREMEQGHVALRGNAYSEIVRGGRGQVTALWPLHPDRVRIERRKGELVYCVAVPGSTSSVPNEPMRRASEVDLRADQMLHLRGLSSDGVVGLSPIRLAAETIGLALAAEAYGAKFFGQGQLHSGVLEHPGSLGKDVAERTKQQFQELHGGLANAHGVAVLEDGMKWHEVGMHNDDAQFLQTRGFQVGDIARVFRMPGVMIGYEDKTATYASAEQFFLAFVVHTIRPWLVRWEQACGMKLLTPRERQTHFVEHVVEGLLRGDIKSRYDAYAVGRQWGWLSANDVRGLESLNPIEDGDDYLVPLNMIPAGMPLPANRARLVVAEAAARAVRKETSRVRDRATKLAGDPAGWRFWVAEFYREHAVFIAEVLQLEPLRARQYAAEHEAALLAEGLAVLERWDQEAAPALVALALGGTNA